MIQRVAVLLGAASLAGCGGLRLCTVDPETAGTTPIPRAFRQGDLEVTFDREVRRGRFPVHGTITNLGAAPLSVSIRLARPEGASAPIGERVERGECRPVVAGEEFDAPPVSHEAVATCIDVHLRADREWTEDERPRQGDTAGYVFDVRPVGEGVVWLVVADTGVSDWVTGPAEAAGGAAMILGLFQVGAELGRGFRF